MGRDGRLQQLLAEAESEAQRSLVRQGRPLLRPDVFAPETGVTPELRSFYERAHILSRASFPLLFQDRLLGMINYSSATPRQFDEAEVAFLGDLAAQAATAVEGMSLYRDLERSRNEVIAYAAKLEETSRVEHFLARTDALTGIPNRRYLEEVLVAECTRADRNRDRLSIVMSDIDDFKSINDAHGHAAGDEALKLVAQVARVSARASDFVGRWGGDEFLFILPRTAGDEALTFAERFLDKLKATPVRCGENEVGLKASAGVAESLHGGQTDPPELVNRADQALYAAKKSGRNQARIWGVHPKAA
jgi:diguanylate cyclase (GGDEF)-like protein